jgi:hypothetical protein
MIAEAAAHVTPDLIVVYSAIPERVALIADDLDALARHWPTRDRRHGPRPRSPRDSACDTSIATQ